MQIHHLLSGIFITSVVKTTGGMGVYNLVKNEWINFLVESIEGEEIQNTYFWGVDFPALKCEGFVTQTFVQLKRQFLSIKMKVYFLFHINTRY